MRFRLSKNDFCGRWRTAALVLLVLIASSCSDIARPKVEPFYAVTEPPKKQELRWSNGPLPKSLDPARAAAAPEADIVRAIYEGLTELDSRTLAEKPAVAEEWTSSPDHRTWTFHLRKNARWSNGESVTAADFVRSWKRLASLGDRTENRFLFQNIVGMQDAHPDDQPDDFLASPTPSPEANSEALPAAALQTAPNKPVAGSRFGAEAVDEHTLKVRLELPDADFPKLVANPIFRPVYGNGSGLNGPRLNAPAVTNGPFRVGAITEDGVLVERSANYWNVENVGLEAIRFVRSESPEKTLEAYRRGELDVVTNASFSPLALKLLAPYDDFRSTAHSALNFYEVNTEQPPFSDRRVREALAVAIDRAKITEGDLEGQMQPASTFYPFGRRSEFLTYDAAKARDLLDRAGYPNARGFPPVRLVVNRNDTQQRVARAVARMWKQNLNLETEIIVRESEEIPSIREVGVFDLIRRGVVMPANDTTVALTSLLGSVRKAPAAGPPPASAVKASPTASPAVPADNTIPVEEAFVEVISEEDALFELRIIPLYFPTSYALVKPYVRGFELNAFDAPTISEVSIDDSWRPDQ